MGRRIETYLDQRCIPQGENIGKILTAGVGRPGEGVEFVDTVGIVEIDAYGAGFGGGTGDA